MIKKQCHNCYYFNSCGCDSVCEDYCAVGDLAEDEYVNEIIENNRNEFTEEWYRYIIDFYNCD